MTGLSQEGAKKKLQKIGQQHLLDYWEELSSQQQSDLLRQVDSLDLSLFEKQKKLIGQRNKKKVEPLTPIQAVHNAGNISLKKQGLQKIAEGKVGCLVVAGGQGTRLHLNGPKGVIPITAIKRKSLFQLLAERLLAASVQAGRPLRLAIMTSPLNHNETKEFFKTHHLFGLSEEQLSFFSQTTLPRLDDQANLFLEDVSKVAQGPDGNGMALAHFVKSGLWQRWKDAGVQQVTFLPIDNPLADPYDAELIGFHSDKGLDASIKCIERLDPKEPLGLIVREKGRIRVVEYTEVPEEEKEARTKEGHLRHRFANISLFCFDMHFIERACRLSLPLHLAHKKAQVLNPSKKQSSWMAWKFETFIFDLLPHAQKVDLLAYPRQRCFAPLKCLKGPGSLSSVQRALLYHDRQTLKELTEQAAPKMPIELDPQFYYPTKELINQWKSRSFKGGYIHSHSSLS